MLKPKRPFESVVRELTEGLEHGTIKIEANTGEAQSQPLASRAKSAERNSGTVALIEMPQERGKETV